MREQNVLKLSLKIKYTPLLNIKNTILKIPEGSHKKLALWVGLQTDVTTLLEIGFIKILLECSSGIVTCAKFLLGDIGCLKQTMYMYAINNSIFGSRTLFGPMQTESQINNQNLTAQISNAVLIIPRLTAARTTWRLL